MRYGLTIDIVVGKLAVIHIVVSLGIVVGHATTLFAPVEEASEDCPWLLDKDDGQTHDR